MTTDTSLKMLQMILSGQNSIKTEIVKVRKELSDVEDRLNKKIDDVREDIIKLTSRVDRLGLDLAKLSDDAPTIEEFDELKVRVDKLQRQFAFS